MPISGLTRGGPPCSREIVPFGAAPRPHPSLSFLWDSTGLPEVSGSNLSRELSGTGSALPLLGPGETFSCSAAWPGVANPVRWGVVPGLWGLRPSGNQMGARDLPIPQKSECCAACHWLVPWESTTFAGGLNPHGASLVLLFSEAQQGPAFLVVRQLASGCCKGSTFPFAEK